MVLKIIFGVTMVAFTTFCGYLFARKYRQRRQFCQQLKEFNERYLSEISYARRPIKTFISSYQYKGEFAEFLRKYFEILELGEVNILPFDLKKEYAFLKEEDCQVVSDYFLMLGKGDSFSQKGYFTSVKERIAAVTLSAENTCKKYGDLYVKIGFLCGLLILIIIL